MMTVPGRPDAGKGSSCCSLMPPCTAAIADRIGCAEHLRKRRQFHRDCPRLPRTPDRYWCEPPPHAPQDFRAIRPLGQEVWIRSRGCRLETADFGPRRDAMRPCVARISSPYRSTNGVAIGLGQHAEAMRQSDQVANFGRRAQCYVQVVQVVALGPACTALHDVRRHRDCGSTKLRLEGRSAPRAGRPSCTGRRAAPSRPPGQTP